MESHSNVWYIPNECWIKKCTWIQQQRLKNGKLTVFVSLFVNLANSEYTELYDCKTETITLNWMIPMKISVFDKHTALLMVWTCVNNRAPWAAIDLRFSAWKKNNHFISFMTVLKVWGNFRPLSWLSAAIQEMTPCNCTSNNFFPNVKWKRKRTSSSQLRVCEFA